MRSKHIHLLALLLTAFYCTVVSLHAQGQDEDLEEEESFTREELQELENLPAIPENQSRINGERSFAIFCYSNPDTELYYLRGGKPQRITFNVGSVRHFQYSEQAQINLAKLGQDENGAPIYITIATVTPPSSSKDGIVILNQSSFDNTKPYRLPYIDLSSKAFRKGAVNLVNLTPTTLVYQLGGNKGELEPYQSAQQALKEKHEFYPVRVGIYDDDGVRLFYRNTFQSEHDGRVLLMISPNMNKKQTAQPIRCLFYKDKGEVRG